MSRFVAAQWLDVFRRLVIHLLLVAGFALATFGTLEWYRIGFTLVDVLHFSLARGLHPLHVMVLGVAMIPPAFRELHLMDRSE